ncbi:glycerol-3-phosphate dehydrogenase subunit B [Propionispira arboris]|uniref:Glycerol-3-phosphate dehydrogenase subunit B n=1 Tax=Propionispira arboris TaxID=84035 RepID=A0A1H7D4L3_9FIRM|nr:anaerobic glycerol-3-phosphate dehydrogenase subunit GlpB [Propionispira arboris]SEJ96749.1 glycerol-3-phosphate dehydrogenase subunit B [Propionispira arboris]
MIKSDVIVIGAGFAGLMAAAVSAKCGKKVTLITYGSGTFPLNSGLIDIMARPIDETVCATPLDGIKALPEAHPYTKIGTDIVEAAVAFFMELCEQENYPYSGSLTKHQWVVTALGTMKPTCLVPKTMLGDICLKNKEIVLIGFNRLKDHYIHVMKENLEQSLGKEKNYTSIMVDADIESGRDLSTLDIARWLNTPQGYESCLKQLRGSVQANSVVILPQVLGVKPDYAILDKMKKDLQCEVLESTGLPPAANGLRLQSMLLGYLKKNNVTMVENAKVIGSTVNNQTCLSITTQNAAREQTYQADHFILATGGFYGGGLQMETFPIIKEPIFNIPVRVKGNPEEWANEKLFSSQKQPFAEVGIETDEKMRPLDEVGNCFIKNVFVAGRNLSGYDFCFEQSGNGVALVSAYQAAMSF